jgi:hypothetical protein
VNQVPPAGAGIGRFLGLQACAHDCTLTSQHQRRHNDDSIWLNA